jgi:hypothetical protein
MSVWRTARDELAGAWRSLRYDLHRRSDPDALPAADCHDATSNEVSTFGGAGAHLYSVHDEYADSPRRLVAVSAFGLLALTGAAGSYLAVVNGLGDRLAADLPTFGPFPLVAEGTSTPAATVRRAPAARLGNGAPLAPSPVAQATPLRTRAAMAATTSAGPRRFAEGGVAPRTVGPVRTPCRCAPPAPIPTFPSAGPRPTSSQTGSPAPSPTPSPSPSPGASPGAPDGAYPSGPPRDRPGT